MSKCSPYPPERTADLGGEHVLPLSTSPHRADSWTFFPSRLHRSDSTRGLLGVNGVLCYGFCVIVSVSLL